MANNDKNCDMPTANILMARWVYIYMYIQNETDLDKI